MPNEISDFLLRWENLMGAIIGGLFSLGVALLVAYQTNRREDRAAAMLLVGTLVSFSARKASLEELARQRSVPEADYHKWLSEKLVQSRPKLSSEFEAALVRLMPADVYLAAHLELIKTLYYDMNENLDRLTEDYKNLHERGAAQRPISLIESDAKLATASFEVAVKHAQCAEHLISRVIFSQIPSWHRLRRWLCPTQVDRKCRELIKRG